MTRKEFGSLVFKIAALYFWFQSLMVAISAIMSVRSYALMGQQVTGHAGNLFDYGSIIAGSDFAVALLLGLVGWFLAHYSQKLSARLFGGPGEDSPVASIPLDAVQVVAFSVIGLYLGATAIPGLFRFLPLLYIRTAFDPTAQRSVWAQFLSSLAQLIIGVLLFFGSESLVSLWWWLRFTAGSVPPEESKSSNDEKPAEDASK